jgi:GNAT superfamily N-acetyltransferase
MEVTTFRSGARLSVRPYAPDDEAAVLDLVAADRLPGQRRPRPRCSPRPWRADHRWTVAGGRNFDEREDPPGKRLEVREGGGLVAEATIGCPAAGIGVLWWISVVPTARGRGLGLALLGSALDLLAGLGAREVILYVDDDAPPGDPERDRTAANALYNRAGFTEVDRLHSFTRRP